MCIEKGLDQLIVKLSIKNCVLFFEENWSLEVETVPQYKTLDIDKSIVNYCQLWIVYFILQGSIFVVDDLKKLGQFHSVELRTEYRFLFFRRKLDFKSKSCIWNTII